MKTVEKIRKAVNPPFTATAKKVVTSITVGRGVITKTVKVEGLDVRAKSTRRHPLTNIAWEAPSAALRFSATFTSPKAPDSATDTDTPLTDTDSTAKKSPSSS